jgi:tetratricopeptide (TPR) repeat protein
MKSLSMRVFRPIAVGLLLCEPLLLWCATGEILPTPPQAATGRPAERIDIEALQKLAQQEGESGQTTEAIRDYHRALELRPEWKEGWWNLGVLQYGDNRFGESISTLQHVVKFAPSLGAAWSLLGLSEFETRDFGDALVHLEKAQSLGIKDDAEIERVSNYHLALLLVRAGKFQRASDLLLAKFGGGQMSEQLKIALGLATLRIALLPEGLDPSQEALVLAVGGVASGGAETLDRFPGLLRTYPDVPYLHYAYGLSLAKAGRDKQAISLMREETVVSPESTLPWIEVSRLQLRLGAVNEALTAARKAVALGPTSKLAHESLATALESAGDTGQAAAEKKISDHLTVVEEAPEQRIVLRYANANANSMLGTTPKADEELWNRAMKEYAERQYSASADDLKVWLRQNPDTGTGWAVLGLNEFALNDFDNAIIHLERGAKFGLSGSPESLQSARYTLGVLLIRAGEFEQASDVLASALKGGLLDEKVEYALGLALLRRPEIPGQGKQQDAALVSTAGKIASLLRNSEYDAAFPQFQRLLKENPSTPFLHYAYGTALLAVSKFDEASAQMQAERAISPASELPCIRLASIALRQHNFTDAITWSRRALLLSANSAEGHYLLGRASLESGDDATALRELEDASRLSPASPEIHFNLAKAYARAKMPEKAEQERATFSQLNEMAEDQRSRHGAQIYAGPRDAVDVTTTPPVQASPHPPPRSN